MRLTVTFSAIDGETLCQEIDVPQGQAQGEYWLPVPRHGEVKVSFERPGPRVAD